MTSTRQQRDKDKAILMATLNYLLEYHSGDMVFDGYSPSKVWYLDELRKTEVDIKKSNMPRLRKRLDLHLSLLKERNDLGFKGYIKQHTGYDIDIFEKYKRDIMPILCKSEIGGNDVYPIEKYLKVYAANPEEQDPVAKVTALLSAYQDKLKHLQDLHGTVVINGQSIVDEKGREVSEASYRKWLDSWLLSEEIAPDGISRLTVQTNGKGEHALTDVVISLTRGVGSVYTTQGARLPIKAYWKDNKNVVIKIKSEYQHFHKYSQVSSYGEVINIEYQIDG